MTVLSAIALHGYRLVSAAAAPLLPLFLARRRRKGLEDGTRLRERYGIASRPRPDGRLIWIHAASVGETLSLLPILTRAPQTAFLVTTVTRTAADLLAAKQLPHVIHQYAPPDLPRAVGRFLQHWRPDAGIIAESELWPNLLREAHTAGIPLTLLNGRLSPRSLNRWRKAPGLLRALLENFDNIFTQTPELSDALHALGIPYAQPMPNLKYAADPLPADPGLTAKIEPVLAGRPVWMAASTHPGEERIMLEAHARLRIRLPDALLILAPRHPHRVPEILKICPQGTRCLRDTPDGRTPVLVADRLGVLGTFFAFRPVTVMGGSFVPVGGHNPLEPALFGCALACGPHMFNFQAVTDLLGEHLSHTDAAGLAGLLETLFADPELKDRRADLLRTSALSRKAQAVEWIGDFIANHITGEPDRARSARNIPD